jgi:hypothetical protein
MTRAGFVSHPEGLNEFCQSLENRFKQSPSQAWARLNACRYTVLNARNHRSVSEYIANVQAASKACGQGDNKFGIVMQAWMKIDVQLRQFLCEPHPSTTLEQFVEELHAHEANWADRSAIIQRNERYLPSTPCNGQYPQNYDQNSRSGHISS